MSEDILMTPGERALVVIEKLKELESARFALEVRATTDNIADDQPIEDGGPTIGEMMEKLEEARERLAERYGSMLEKAGYPL